MQSSTSKDQERQLSQSSSLLHVQPRRLTQDELEDLHHELETYDHVIPLESLCQKLFTDPVNGLTEEKALKNLLRDGLNALSPPEVIPEYIKFLKCLYGGFSALMWVCVFLCFLTYFITYLIDEDSEGVEWLGVIIIIICVISGIFAYVQEGKTLRVMESFKKMVPTYATVIRDGAKLRIITEEIALGDLVELKTGDKIPADVRIIRNNGLRVENSNITGESTAVSCTDYPTDDNPMESKNIAFFSCYAVGGNALAIVIAVGDRTMIGRLANLTSQLDKTKTPISLEIRHFVQIITTVALLCGFVFFGLSLILEPNIAKAFTYLLGIIIANVPEVLLITVTTTLTLTAQKMANKNCLVKNLEAVETLGSASVICSDKTGTLTQNKMTVSSVWLGNTYHRFSPTEWFGVEKDILMEKKAFNIMLKAATLCLRADFRSEARLSLMPASLTITEQPDVLGDASESGILKFCERMHPTRKYRDAYPTIAEIPFSSKTKYSLSIHREPDGYIIIVKGAPEVILDFCESVLNSDGETVEMTDTDRDSSRRAVSEMGYLSERVIAYADFYLTASQYGPNYKFNTEKPEKYNFPIRGYRFLGFISLLDPPRPGVPDAVYKCRTAGIKVIMITGDHPVTAMAIAKKVGIISEGNESKFERAFLQNTSLSKISDTELDSIVLTGAELRHMSSDELDQIIQNYEEIVFARTSPQQKLLIVESCQRLGEIVAVTGDGVNDAPALRKANIGVAMGIAGSDVAKNAADMILMDDNFASIVTGVEEGRLIFDNLKKSIAYTLTSSVPEMLPMLTSLLFGIPLPLVIEMVLCIDIGTDIIPALALAYEKSESDIMKRPPRNPQYDKLVNKRMISITYGQIGMIQSLAGFYTYFVILMYNGFFPSQLIGLRYMWEDKTVESIPDFFDRPWSHKDRMNLINEARSGYFVSIVITQLIDLIICKTRRNSIIKQGMGNWFLNFSFVFEIILTAALLYIPGTAKIFKTMPLEIHYFWPPLSYAIFLFIYDEIRRYFIRKYPGGIMEQETYY